MEIEYDKLPAALDGFTVAHISDLHLKSFIGHRDKLVQVFDSINSYEPDIIVNTGDFVTFLWNEMEAFTVLLGSLHARYGVYAIPGNHDTGLYSKEYNGGNYDEHLGIIRKMLENSHHTFLNDTSIFITVDSLTVSLTGIVTYGMVPDLYYGDTEGAFEGTVNSDFNILLSHDPNHWLREIQYRDDIELTLSGHTHGMQTGILLPGFQLSPASILYPAWNGLYGRDNNYLYVNRGLGTIGIPARIGMSPEITIIKIKAGCK
ncbi:MAG: metallophosphoesterase [Bacteroidales bacterium]|nr:metallophosphoesterase [Bacteroidales bacterium]